ncbi:MAG: hypothetical protein V7K64_10585 [Nostoc sp.]|uniref:hypothetical protein n=1 Tax=Nostoc sp. TaxID=1180 RepID=UPI002FF5ED05
MWRSAYRAIAAFATDTEKKPFSQGASKSDRPITDENRENDQRSLIFRLLTRQVGELP